MKHCELIYWVEHFKKMLLYCLVVPKQILVQHMARDKAYKVKTRAWYIDLGASCHFTNKRDWYINYVANESSNDFWYLVVGRNTWLMDMVMCK